MSDELKAPFPWFGGKSRVADVVWQRFGPVRNYVEPFFGSGAVLLARPDPPGIETVNDLDGFISNFWRAVAMDPEAVAHHADWPINENDLHARHAWLVKQRDDLSARLEGDPEYYDAKIAGWWVWGISCWIGRGWCSGQGPWQAIDGRLQRVGSDGQGVWRQLPNLGHAGQGVKRQLPHLGDGGRGVNRKGQAMTGYFEALAERLAGVRVGCGDWLRVTGPSVTTRLGTTGVFLDPPYIDGCDKVYSHNDDVHHDVRAWAVERGNDPDLRIALCGYDGEHDMPEGWTCHEWKTAGGYGSQGDGNGRANASRERIWFSPHCLAETGQGELFEEVARE